MRVVITGAAGFLGQKLTHKLIEVGKLTGADGKVQPITDMVLFDVFPAPKPEATGISFTVKTGDLTQAGVVDDLFAEPVDSVFHLAAVMSGQAEQDFDLGMRVNLNGTLGVLEACRRQAGTPKFVMPASVAVMGGEMPDVVPDDLACTPTNSYGTQKAICELLVSDFSRKGFLDGRVVRLPTIVVRPGKPNAAASSFASGMIREPLQGEASEVPVPKDTKMWIMSPRTAILTLIRTHEVEGAKLGHKRTITPVGLTATVEEMADSLRRVGGEEAYGRLSWGHDDAIAEIICGWAGTFASTRARTLGFESDESMDAIVKAFMEDDMVKPGA